MTVEAEEQNGGDAAAEPFEIELPALSLVVLVGVSGSGKSTFAARHFRATEVVSSDACRAFVGDDETDQKVSAEAFELLRVIVRQRLKLGRLTVVDATHLSADARKPLVELAREFHALPVAVVFQVPEKLCCERTKERPDRDFGPRVVRQQFQQLRRGLRTLKREGFRYQYRFSSPAEVDAAEVRRVPLWNDRREERGPFDIVGDVHGCYDELIELLGDLGYGIEPFEGGGGLEGDDPATAPDLGLTTVTHPEGRVLVFVGDLVDRGPKSVEVLRLAMGSCASGAAFCVPGNHDVKLLRKLDGRNVQLTHGLPETLEQLDAAEAAEAEGQAGAFREAVRGFLRGLISHYVFDRGRLVVAHAGLKEEMQGRGSGAVREFALYGETTGETDAFGLPVRHDWAAAWTDWPNYGNTPRCAAPTSSVTQMPTATTAGRSSRARSRGWCWRPSTSWRASAGSTVAGSTPTLGTWKCSPGSAPRTPTCSAPPPPWRSM